MKQSSGFAKSQTIGGIRLNSVHSKLKSPQNLNLNVMWASHLPNTCSTVSAELIVNDSHIFQMLSRVWPPVISPIMICHWFKFLPFRIFEFVFEDLALTLDTKSGPRLWTSFLGLKVFDCTAYFFFRDSFHSFDFLIFCVCKILFYRFHWLSVSVNGIFCLYVTH